jgi:plasmid stability protein
MLMHMKRTTLLLDTALYADLKRRAAASGRTLTAVVDEALRAGLRADRAPRRRLALPSYDLGPYREPPDVRGAELDRSGPGDEEDA